MATEEEGGVSEDMTTSTFARDAGDTKGAARCTSRDAAIPPPVSTARLRRTGEEELHLKTPRPFDEEEEASSVPPEKKPVEPMPSAALPKKEDVEEMKEALEEQMKAWGIDWPKYSWPIFLIAMPALEKMFHLQLVSPLIEQFTIVMVGVYLWAMLKAPWLIHQTLKRQLDEIVTPSPMLRLASQMTVGLTVAAPIFGPFLIQRINDFFSSAPHQPIISSSQRQLYIVAGMLLPIFHLVKLLHHQSRGELLPNKKPPVRPAFTPPPLVEEEEKSASQKWRGVMQKYAQDTRLFVDRKLDTMRHRVDAIERQSETVYQTTESTKKAVDRYGKKLREWRDYEDVRFRALEKRLQMAERFASSSPEKKTKVMDRVTHHRRVEKVVALPTMRQRLVALCLSLVKASVSLAIDTCLFPFRLTLFGIISALRLVRGGLRFTWQLGLAVTMAILNVLRQTVVPLLPHRGQTLVQRLFLPWTASPAHRFPQEVASKPEEVKRPGKSRKARPALLHHSSSVFVERPLSPSSSSSSSSDDAVLGQRIPFTPIQEENKREETKNVKPDDVKRVHDKTMRPPALTVPSRRLYSPASHSQSHDVNVKGSTLPDLRAQEVKVHPLSAKGLKPTVRPTPFAMATPVLVTL